MANTVRLLPETVVAERRLGRHVDHDERSRAYDIEQLVGAGKLPTGVVEHRRHIAVLQQGDLGACTGNALVGALMTDPLYRKGSEALGEPDAVEIYEKATLLDNVPGSYPPDDTGSSGLAVCKAAKQMGLLSSYRHAFSWTAALRALAQTPIIVGVSWYDSFDEPDARGFVSIGADAQVRGGHEFELVGFDAEARTVHAVNSWGTHWGLHGRFTFSWDDLERLLSKAEQGDATVPIR
jgi:hypothetical protein